MLDVAGMILGGIVAAPIAARLVGKLPVKTMFVAVGTLVMVTSALDAVESAGRGGGNTSLEAATPLEPAPWAYTTRRLHPRISLLSTRPET
ncbi:hypothetical protein ACQ86N_14475 [Puia sp. P3]|uniref:hypothetical protein n=1 Tax=Puia sp. P3 TaxID=3423952 RepID=UPI003D67D85E